MKTYRSLLLALFVTTTLAAQLPPIGQPFALTNTRYRPARGSSPVLRTNGRDAFLFWEDGKVRVTRLGNNAPGVSVFDYANYDRDSFDAVWTGTHFLVVDVVVFNSEYRLYGRIVDANGVTAGDAFPITALEKVGRWPRLAFNGKYVLLVMDDNSLGSVSSIALTPDGQPAGFAAQKFAAMTFQLPPAVASNGDRFAVITGASNQTLSMFDANGQFISARPLTDNELGWRALASDGRRFLAVEGRETGLNVILIQPDGSFIGDTKLESLPFSVREPVVTWNGSGWVIAYKNADGTRMTVVETDADGRLVTSRSTIDGTSKPTIVSVGSRVVTSWVDNNSLLIFAADPPAGAAAPVSVTATNQQLLASATSSSAMLVLWRDGAAGAPIRAGIRTRDGRWRERELAPSTTIVPKVAAASDGHDFMVVIDGTLIRLDEELHGEPGNRVTDFTPEAIAWNGSNYAVIAPSMIALVSPAGVVSPTVVLPIFFDSAMVSPHIASDGAGWFVVWPTKITCSVFPELPCYPHEVAGIHLDADLHITDPSPLTFGTGKEIHSFDVASSGSQYVVAWSTPTGVAASRVGTQETTLLSSSNSATGVTVAGFAGGVAIGWTENYFRSPRFESRVALLGDTSPVLVVQGDDTPTLRVAPLPGGDLALLHSSWQKDAPLHGTNHVMMAIGAFGLPPLPDAPLASLKQNGNTLILGWSPPPQRVNGYRVEYRVNNGPWIEVDRWFDPEERTYTTNIPAGASLALRVRAWNDAGTGAYSQAVATNTNRTRSARH
jgi:fibronectin type III domain protein